MKEGHKVTGSQGYTLNPCIKKSAIHLRSRNEMRACRPAVRLKESRGHRRGAFFPCRFCDFVTCDLVTLKAIQDDQAFTLVEIILVVVVLGAVTMFAVPNMRGAFKSVQLKRTASDAASLMRYAQSRAVLKDMEIVFEFDEPQRMFRILTSREDVSSKGQDVIPGRWGRAVRVPEPITCELGQGALRFYPDGRADKARLICCHESRCLTVSTQDQRGRVLLIEGRVD